MTCIGRDPLCPCADGDQCHYKGDNPWPVPGGHSPGPWEIDDRPESDWIFIEPLVCQIERGSARNRHLIVAAPELLEALEDLLLIAVQHLQYSGDEVDNARTAIAKAKGGAITS